MAPEPPSGRPRLTPLAWVLIVGALALVPILLIAKRGALADAAFLGLALIVLVLARAMLPPSSRPRRRWRDLGGRWLPPPDPPGDDELPR
jgi:hypothetical protein